MIACPVCGFAAEGDAPLIEHMLESKGCLPISRIYRSYTHQAKECWCGAPQYYKAGWDTYELYRHFIKCGGMDQHYTDVLMGVQEVAGE